MFEMCNWKSAPATVANNWATKSVMHYRNPARGTWYTDDVEPSSEFATDVVSLALKSSLLAALLTTSQPSAVRSLRSVTRNGDTVTVGDWVVVRQIGEQACAGRITEMMECRHPSKAFSSIRLHCENWKPVYDDEMTGAVWAASGDGAEKPKVVLFESVHAEVVVRSVMSVRDEFM